MQVETLGRDNDPTPERLSRAGLKTTIQLGTGRLQVINPPRGFIGFDGVVRLSQAPLDRLAARDQLDPVSPDRNHNLFQAGDKLRDHHHMAGLSGFAANDLNGSGGGHPSSRTPITETMEKHRRAIRIAEGAMDRDAWIAVRAIIIEEQTLVETGRAFGYGKEHAASAVALDRLRRGLGALASLWGYLPPERPERAAPAAANDAAPAAKESAA
ncbi:hypothetical protein ACLBX9_16775 [Methylobacterium sp. A49B]